MLVEITRERQLLCLVALAAVLVGANELVGQYLLEERKVLLIERFVPGTFELNPGLVIVKELEILGAYATTREELDVALELTAAGKVRSCVSEVLPLSEAERVHARLEDRKIAGRVVLVPPGA